MLRDHGETVDAGIDQKAFEPSHSSSCERFDIALIVVNHAAPCRPVNAASALRSRTLGLQCRHRSCRRKAVQRHVDEQCVTSGRCRPRRGFEALPLASTRLINMNVGVDQPRKDGQFTEVMNLKTLWNFVGSNHRLDPLSLNQDGGRTNSVRCYYPSRNKGLQAQTAGSLYGPHLNTEYMLAKILHGRQGPNYRLTKFRLPAYTRLKLTDCSSDDRKIPLCAVLKLHIP